MGAAGLRWIVWAALMALLALTVGLTFAPLGPWRLAAGLAIALAKTGLILWVYMDLRKAGGVVRLAALASVFFLAVLLGLTWLDFAARAGAMG
jgi:cytochrome c oxidase subunit 4